MDEGFGRSRYSDLDNSGKMKQNQISKSKSKEQSRLSAPLYEYDRTMALNSKMAAPLTFKERQYNEFLMNQKAIIQMFMLESYFMSST